LKLRWCREVQDKLSRSSVGIAGVGGLGSHCALALARSRIGKLVLADVDVVEEGNLLRQNYSVDQVGQSKVEATRDNLLLANPDVDVEVHNLRVTSHNFMALFGKVDVLVEAFDDADQKVMLAESAARYRPDLWVVMGSGVAGFGSTEEIRVTKVGRLVVIGDGHSSVAPDNYCIAPRVGIVAFMQANVVLEILLTGDYGGGE